MEAITNLQPQPNINQHRNHCIAVCLLGDYSGNTALSKKKSGLFRISSAEYFQYADKKLRDDLKYWVPLPSDINMTDDEVLIQMGGRPIMFYDVTDCNQFIRSHEHKCIILILSDWHAQNKELVSDFKKCQQIIAVYRCIPQTRYMKLLKRCVFENEYSIPKNFSKEMAEARIYDLDPVSQSTLMEVWFIESVLNVRLTEKAKEDFIRFVHETYRNDKHYQRTYVKQIEDFNLNYNKKDAINWYTRSNSFLFRIVNRTCASLDFPSLFKISFYLRDLYEQLTELHDKQLGTSLKPGLIIYRGAKMSIEELKTFKSKGSLFVTRSFLSTTYEKNVARIFAEKNPCGDVEGSVLIIMKIDYTQLQEKPIAFIGELSSIPGESDVMLPMGIVLRVESYRKMRASNDYTWEIQMIRGEDEVKLEKQLSRIPDIAQTGAGIVLVGAGVCSSLRDNSQHTGLIPTHGQLPSVAASSNPSTSVSLSNSLHYPLDYLN
ncbi:unnamed protein product [Rotaria socialis]|uniref:Uncharacterized protein n=3 Tax=Rotaria socialis TaxID=392032 RepID=A0A817V2Z1_9BILA|nr:unnamed protein product [Rotaria socialis]CAF4883540.1 unnamed protein product [Rotaria socialis]